MGSGARAQAALLPSAPGVYRFRDAAGRVLYLGRAVSLRRRVTSYWGSLGEPAARRHLSATAPEWRDFAQRNATLAARLSA
jgi:excinuclease ABC subunit C